jgi:DNA-binding PadR family transcriptional regulator
VSPDPSVPPLRPAVFHILLALSTRDLHGLGIADVAEEASEGTVELGPGTLYRSLSEMRDSGLVRQVDPPEADADPRRKYYRITDRGRDVLAREASRLVRLVDTARAQNVLPERA